MSTVPKRRPRRQRRDLSAAPPDPPPAVDLSDRDAARRWFAELTVAIEDATSVTADQLTPLPERRLGPAEARRLHREAVDALRKLLNAAERGLVSGSRAPRLAVAGGVA